MCKQSIRPRTVPELVSAINAPITRSLNNADTSCPSTHDRQSRTGQTSHIAVPITTHKPKLNRRQRRRESAKSRVELNLPTVPAIARRNVIETSHLHETEEARGKSSLELYYKMFQPYSLHGLSVCWDTSLNMQLIIMSSAIRIDQNTLSSIIKTSFTEKGSPLHQRNSQYLGIPDESSYVVRLDSSTGAIVAIMLRSFFPNEVSTFSSGFSIIHDATSRGWNKGCEADPRPTINRILPQLKDPVAMKCGGFARTNVKRVISVGTQSSVKPTGSKIVYHNSKGKIIQRPLSSHIDRHTWAKSGSKTILESISILAPKYLAPVRTFLGLIDHVFRTFGPIYLSSRGWPSRVVESNMASMINGIHISSLKTTNHKPIGVHRDPPCPLFAIACGHTIYDGIAGSTTRMSNGGNLILVDGMIRLNYRPTDLVLFDGNFAHTVSSLRHTSKSPASGIIERRSVIAFSKWRREAMKNAYSGFYHT